MIPAEPGTVYLVPTYDTETETVDTARYEVVGFVVAPDGKADPVLAIGLPATNEHAGVFHPTSGMVSCPHHAVSYGDLSAYQKHVNAIGFETNGDFGEKPFLTSEARTKTPKSTPLASTSDDPNGESDSDDPVNNAALEDARPLRESTEGRQRRSRGQKAEDDRMVEIAKEKGFTARKWNTLFRKHGSRRLVVQELTGVKEEPEAPEPGPGSTDSELEDDDLEDLL